MATVKQALANQFSLFPQSTSLFHIGEQSLWKNAWPLFLWTICVKGKNARVWFFLLPLLPEKKPTALKSSGQKNTYIIRVCVCIWCGHLDPQVHFELSCTIKSHRADTVNSWDWGGKQQNSSCIKRLTPEQMGCFTRLTKPKAQDQTPSWWPVHCSFHKRNSK